MSTHDAGAAPDDEELQFDHAEYDTPAEAVTCVACKQPVVDSYYEINGKIFCARCREGVDAYMASGSRIGRFLRAFLLGSVAAVAGFLIYFGVMKLAHLEIGLISILVGFMVGAGVRTGSNRRGGWLYQLLAVFLTYSAIAASYSAAVIPEWLAKEANKQAEAPQIAAAAGNAAGPAQAKPADPPAPPGGAKPAAAPAAGGVPTLGEFAIALAAVLALCYALPIIGGFHSPIGLLIIGFALWEAWKLNKRIPLQFNGPFQVNPPELEELPPDGVPSHA